MSRFSSFCGFDNGFKDTMDGIAYLLRERGFTGRLRVTDFDPDCAKVYFATESEIPADYLTFVRGKGFYIESE